MDNEFILQPRFALESPYLADYFGVWMIHDQTFKGLVDRCQGLNLQAHIQSAEVRQDVASRDNRNFAMTNDGIAVLRIDGAMMKSVPSMGSGTSTVRMRQQLRSARNDSEVKGAMLVMDTPGGTAKGNPDLADEVAAFAAVKPIFAYVEDMTASAGVSVASQATKRYANNATAIYGSMGTYAVIEDLSGLAGQLGVTVHVIRAGEFKGMGTEGTKVTEAQLAELQRVVNVLNDGYLNLIARGLKKPIESIRALADGRAIMASDAVAAGLIDGIQTYEQTYQQLLQLVQKPTSTRRSPAMEKTPATLAELKATFPNSTADWRESQLEAGASLSEAAISYAKHVEAKAVEREEAHKKELEAAKAIASATSGSLGHKPLTMDTLREDAGDCLSETGDAVEDFNAAVARIAGPRADLNRRQQAIRAVANKNPELYRNYLLATNTGKKQTRMIQEKYDSVAAN